MKPISNVMYLKGLAKGAGLDESDARDHLLMAMISTFESIAQEIESIREEVDENSEVREKAKELIDMFTHGMATAISDTLMDYMGDDYDDEYDDEFDDEDDDDDEDNDFQRFLRGDSPQE